jgi:chromosome segregation protein
MHVIVGQGRLDAVLSADPEDRRGFIEEAAGVLKHRKRKEKALRKLDAMAANLARLTDLGAEIRRQLGPLAKQADAARRAQVVQAEVRDAHARLLADDLVQLRAALESDVADTTALRDRVAGLEEVQAGARVRLAALEAEAAQAAPELAEAAETWFRLSGLRERVRGTRTLAAERCRLLGAAEPEGTGGRDPEDLSAQAGRARAAEAALAADVEAARSALDAAVEARRTAETEEAEADRALARSHRAIADRREGLAQLAGQVAARRGRLEAAEAELRRLRGDQQSATARAETAQREYAALELEVAGQEEGEEGLDATYEAAVARLQEARAEVGRWEDEEREAEGERATQAARRDALALALRPGDGTDAVLSAEDRPPGLLGLLAEHLTIERGHENAVAAALGELAAAGVAESLDAAVDALRHARDRESGPVRLVVAGLPGGDAPPGAPAPAGGRWAADLVVAADPVAAPVRRLLRRAVLVPDLAAGRLAVAESDVVAVTPLGEVLSRTSAAGGDAGAPSVLELHAAHAAAEARCSGAGARLERARFAQRGARAAADDAEADAARALDDLHASDARLAAVSERLGQLGGALRAARADLDRLEPALVRARETAEAHGRELAALAERLDAARAEPENERDALAGAARRRDEAATAAAGARAAETEARLALRTLEERATSIAGRAASLEQAARTERAARERAAERARRRAEQARVAHAVLATATRAVEAVDRAVDAAERRRDREEEARTAREHEVARTRAVLDETATRLAELTDAMHQDEMARAEQRLRIEALERRAVDDLGLEPAVLVAEFGPDRDVPGPPGEDGEPGAGVPYVRDQQEQRLRAAERALAQLGRVNPLALEEHAALAERHRFLTTQLADLRRSRVDLLEIVREIDERVERAFAEAFADTAREFEGVFARLFPGGEGRLLLTDPESMLTTGVEVEARPAGKKVRRLSLLSGGERSLTAVALLVAIFKARPSPFYVMDEVEAALDDVNLGRLLEIYTELREDSQLVVVTHQKRTMEIADALYGVTMRGDGVTTVVSQRLRDDRPLAVASV